MMIPLAMETLAVLVAAATAWMIWRTSRSWNVIAGLALLMTVQWIAAAVLGPRLLDGRPPLMMPLMLVTIACTAAAAFSRIGRELAGLPIAWLIGLQCFRLPLELVMHQAAATGLMPEQMTFTGYNFDILTGITAVLVSWLARRDKAPRWLLIAWNAMGSVLLAAIVGIAFASLPTFAVFGRDHLNTWIADPPYIWLPGVLVQGALLGHLVIWRKLLLRAKPD
jgi:hypothetical protein